jgi:methylmalonyl-CoA mutase N-terminal domain/subunit
VADTVDPLGGSYYVESLTDDLESEAADILEAVDRRGGMLDAVESGWVKRQIQDVAFDRQQEIESGERVVVGVNEFQVDEEPHVDVEEVDEDDEARQRERLEAVKDDRDDDAVAAALDAVREAAAGDDNVLPPMVDAVKAYATVGEISDVLREEFGEYQPRL